MHMEVIESNGDWIHIRLRGRLDIAGVEQIETRLYAAFAPSGLHALIDISEVDFVSSMGIRVLVTGAKTAAKKNRRFVIIGAQGVVEDSLRSTGIDQFIPIVENRDLAIAELGA